VAIEVGGGGSASGDTGVPSAPLFGAGFNGYGGLPSQLQISGLRAG
jgi:hypothetical protein